MKKKAAHSSVGTLIRSARERLCLRANVAAERLKVSASLLSRWENGLIPIDGDYDARICSVLRVAPEALRAARKKDLEPEMASSKSGRILTVEEKDFLWGVQRELDRWMDPETAERLLALRRPSATKEE